MRPSPLVVRVRSRHTPWWLVSLFVLGACGDSSTEPLNAPPELIVTNAADAEDIVSDVQTRILPNLPASAARSELAAALATLFRALDKGLAAPVRDAIASAYVAVDHVAISILDDADARAELDVVQLQLDALDAQLMTASGSRK